MANPELEQANAELNEARLKLEALALKHLERFGPPLWRRLMMLLNCAGLGTLFVWASSMLLMELGSDDFGGSTGRDRIPNTLFAVFFPLIILLGFRFLPGSRRFTRFYTWEMLGGFLAGVALGLTVFKL